MMIYGAFLCALTRIYVRHVRLLASRELSIDLRRADTIRILKGTCYFSFLHLERICPRPIESNFVPCVETSQLFFSIDLLYRERKCSTIINRSNKLRSVCAGNSTKRALAQPGETRPLRFSSGRLSDDRATINLN